MKSAMETGDMTRNGLMEHCTFGLDFGLLGRKPSEFVCVWEKESAATVLLCVCCFLCCCCCCCFGSWFVFFFSFLLVTAALCLLFVERLHTRSVLALLVFFASGFLWFFVFFLVSVRFWVVSISVFPYWGFYRRFFSYKLNYHGVSVLCFNHLSNLLDCPHLTC
ncbi:hypothetical protein J3E69DRAFT_94517 [Trichoderma sp. SZMC 28015]